MKYVFNTTGKLCYATLLYFIPVILWSLNRPGLPSDTFEIPLLETFRYDTVFTIYGSARSGEIIAFDEHEIVLKGKNEFDEDLTYNMSEVSYLSLRPWILLNLDGSRSIADRMTVSGQTVLLSSESSPSQKTPFKDVGAILNMHSEIGFSGAPKPGNHKLDWRPIYINPIIRDSYDYKAGYRAGRSPSLGSFSWFFRGLFTSLLGPINAMKYKPVPPLYELGGKSTPYVVGYIEGFGSATSASNFVCATVGAVGSGVGCFAVVLMISIASDPNFTN